MNLFTYYRLPFLLLHQLLIAKSTIFNSELWCTSYWYKSCGYYALRSERAIYNKTSKILKPFHWGYFSYSLPTTNFFQYFDILFVLVFLTIVINSAQYFLLFFLITPLFAIYYLGEVKTEKYFFALMWVL